MLNKNLNKKNKRKEERLLENFGLRDITPRFQNYWLFIEENAKNIAELHDFHYIVTSPLDRLELIENSLGEAKDYFKNQVFVLNLKKEKEKLGLRYSFRESVLRSFIENKLSYFNFPLKVFYMENVFRNVEPNDYFLKTFHQVGFQIIGENDPFYDVQIIFTLYDLLRSLKLNNITLKIGSAGCRNCRPAFKKQLFKFYEKNKSELCSKCKSLLNLNPFLIKECENERCLSKKEEKNKELPTIFNSLCNGCNNYLRAVVELLEDNEVPYVIDEHLTAFDELSNKLIFEFSVSEIPYALAFGSRYDYLAEKVFKKQIPVVGANLGIERVIAAMVEQKVEIKLKTKPKVFFLVVGNEAKSKALKIMNSIRLSGITVVEAISKKTFQAQIKYAEKLGIKIILILGQREIYDETIIIRDLESGIQENILISKAVEELKKRIK